MEIMKLIPTGKDYLWGGTRLREEYGKKIDLTPLAETWECSVHPDGPSYVANGTYKGNTLADVLKAHPEYLGTKVENGELPVLVKFIDAKKDLSVQVHPSDDYAREHEGDNGKTEMWYVIDADEGASLIYGFQHEVTEEILRKAIETGTLDKHLQKVPVHKGDTYFVPAGTVHGIGKGILVAEIQESSNVTYRVYDYDRVDKNGKKRELHFDKAVQVMNMKVAPDVSQKPRIVKYYSGCSRELLCRCKYFETERIQVTKGFAFSVMDASFQVLMCLDGYGEVQTMDAEQRPMRFSKGETLFLPAGLGRCLVVGDAELIQEKKSAYVVTPNVDHIVQLETNKELQAVYKNASLILTDGKPLLWIANWYGTPIKEKISGSDLFPLLCEMAAEKGYKMFFLGAAEGVAAKAAENLMNRFKGLQVVGTYSPPFGFEKDPVEMDKIKSMIKEATPHILIVGLGCPKQEKFMYHHCAELGVPISFGLGASFDFEAGNIKRAPRWMANHGLEWLFRITQDPKRMAKRYLVDDRKILGLAIKYRK